MRADASFHNTSCSGSTDLQGSNSCIAFSSYIATGDQRPSISGNVNFAQYQHYHLVFSLNHTIPYAEFNPNNALKLASPKVPHAILVPVDAWARDGPEGTFLESPPGGSGALAVM